MRTFNQLKWFYMMALSILLFASCDPLKIFGSSSTATYSLIPVEGLSASHISDDKFFYVNLYATYYVDAGFDPLDGLVYALDEGPGTDCKIPIEQESSEDLYCIMDVMEGDLWFHELHFGYNVPAGMCDFLSFETHWHFNQKMGYGPELVFECNNYFTGVITEGSPEIETRYCLGGCVAGILTNTDGDSSTVTTECLTGTSRTEVNQFCADLDRSEYDLANCCLGEYELRNQDGESIGLTNWGGRVGECIGGLGRISWEYFNENGLPLAVVTNALAEGYSDVYELPALVNVYGGARYPREKGRLQDPAFITANYWSDVENKDFLSNNPDFYISPTASELPADYLRPYTGKQGYPYVTWSCLDKAREVKHRIHLVIREWNTQEEFNSFISTEGSRGDPDVVGAEGSFCDYYEAEEADILRDTDCNDLTDVDNWDAAPSGSGGSYNPYPGIIYQ